MLYEMPTNYGWIITIAYSLLLHIFHVLWDNYRGIVGQLPRYCIALVGATFDMYKKFSGQYPTISLRDYCQLRVSTFALNFN